MKTLLAILAMLACGGASAGPAPLPDSELAAVRGADGISFALDLHLNRENGGASGDSRLVIGQKVDERTTYIVMRNIGGRIQMVGLNLSAQTAPDGSGYVALTLPAYTRYTDVGFESLSVQADPHGAVSGNLGRISLNGEMMMQGQLRLWSH